MNPYDAISLAIRGYAKLSFNHYEAAIQDFDMAINLNPNDTRYYRDRGNAKFNLNHYEAAI